MTLARCPSENGATASAEDTRVRVPTCIHAQGAYVHTRTRAHTRAHAHTRTARVSAPQGPRAPRIAFCSRDGLFPLAWMGEGGMAQVRGRLLLVPVARDSLSSPVRPDPPSPEVAPCVRVHSNGG